MTLHGVKRLVAAVVVAGAVCAGVGGCALGEDVSGQQEQRLENNLAKQKQAALKFIQNQPDVEKIRFTQEGNNPGLGSSWGANAVVTIDGKEYDEILGLNTLVGDPLPDTPPAYTPRPVTVVYSDGSSEVLG